MLASDPTLYAVAVVDDAGVPIGLLGRFPFLERLSGRFGRALTDRRPVESVMDREPLILDDAMPLDEVGERFVSADNHHLFDSFVVTRDGLYAGVATGFDLMRAQTELRHSELARQAEHDVLTGLPNREKFERTLRSHVRNDGTSAAFTGLLFIDLDRFKQVNDSFGHRVGDQLLQRIGQRFRAHARPEDLVARLSGDEFAMILPNLRDPGEAERIATAILASCTAPLMLDGHEIVVSCSLGVALHPEDARSADGLTRAADAAVYHAKQVRNTHQRYRREMSSGQRGTAMSFSTLRHAIDEHQLTLHYQPFIDLQTDEITGVEALVRWPHPRGGMVPAEELVRIAEDSGLIIAITEYVVRTAIRDLLDWGEQTGREDLTMAVNISTVQLLEGGLVAMIDRLVGEAGLDPQRLTLELTESAAMRGSSSAYATLTTLKQRGYSLAIDDFGTGYSSLSQLERLPVDILKIDQSFVAGIGQTGRNGAIARAIVALGQSLGLRLVAEGVETPAQLAFLRDLRCDVAQGVLLGEPVPANRMLARLLTEADALQHHDHEPQLPHQRPHLKIASRS
jgi:diguanylate cyclase (GGDEF)-like protein